MNRPIFLFCILLAACTSNQKEEIEKNPPNLIGTWERVRYVDTDISDSSWVDQNPKNIFLKHITPTHFTWLSFNTESQQLNGTGGGTYTYDGDTYSEDIHFFYPTGSSIQGKTIPFTVDFKDSLWHHVGYYQGTALDPELNEMVRSDTMKIEEMWRKISSPNEYSQLVGTWVLVSRKSHQDSIRVETFPFMQYYKLVTPTHFNWVQINLDDNEVYAEGGGTYTLSANTYTEQPEYYYPIQEALSGLTIPFQFQLDDQGRWIHKGAFVKPLLDSMGVEIGTDSVFVDEVWRRWGPEDSSHPQDLE